MNFIKLALQKKPFVNYPKTTLLNLVLVISISILNAQTKTIVVPPPGQAFTSVVKLENIDTTVFADWVDGKERHIIINTKDILNGPSPQAGLWTDKTEPTYHGMSYGNSKNTGIRHLRIGFHQSINVGSIMADGGGRPSVLKDGAAYPGDLNDESQWIPAQRLVDGQLSDKELVAGNYAIWVFPSGTKTRAIRFSHQPSPLNANYSGNLQGALVTEERFCNMAIQSLITTKSNNQNTKFINNEVNDEWANIGADAPQLAKLPVISKDNAEWIVLRWPQPINLSGLAALWTGFSVAEVQTYVGANDQNPVGGDESQWKSIAEYSMPIILSKFWPNILDFGQQITTKAIRIKIIQAMKVVTNGNLTNKDLHGKRIWVGDIFALQSISNKPLQSNKSIKNVDMTTHPPVAIPFTLKEGGYVTLVIEDKQGMRVRNLIADTWFDSGKDTAWWDGLDDLGRDVEAAQHGLYRIPSKFIQPGEYHVRGLVHGEINTNYQFSFYAPGNPPWTTDDHTGGWLANHTAPQSALFVPANQSPTGQSAVYLGCYVTEGPDGLAWVDLDGNKMGGKKWVGGVWTAAPYLARDAGVNATSDVYAYVGSVWQSATNNAKGELRINALTASGDKSIITYQLGDFIKSGDAAGEIGGLAVNNGVAVVSLSYRNQLLFIDVNAKKVIDSTKINSPHGLAFDSQNRLLALSYNQLLRFNSFLPVNSAIPQTIITSGLEAPVGITTDELNQIYISDGGASNQIKVYTKDGNFIQTIGKPGKPKAGAYDSLHMNNPYGITIDSKQQLWVAENDFLPKRVSVWTLDGKLIKAFYGPAKYGGGGTLDSYDKTKFYYAEEYGSMEFALNWKSGESRLKSVFYRKTPESLDLAFRSAAPETALYHNGKRYFTNCYNSNPTNGHSSAFLFVERNGIAYPTTAVGKANDWDLLKQDKFKSVLPLGIDLSLKNPQTQVFFIWNDLNGDAQVQPGEVAFQKGTVGGVTIMNDLSFCLTLDGKAIQLPPNNFSPTGTPFYRFDSNKVLVEGVLPRVSSGGGQILAAPDGWTIVTQGILPFDKFSISGARYGKPNWSYPNLWPGLHPAHEAPLPSFPGELIGPTRLLGGLMDFKGSDSGPLWAINSNHGMVYIFTSDGLFVSTLFEPMRTGKPWKMPLAQRGMSLKGITLGEENFWPTITQTSNGEVYLVDGTHTSLIKVDGLDNIHRLPISIINVSAADLAKSRNYQIEVETKRQKSEGTGILYVSLCKQPIKVDGKFDDWTGSTWVDIDQSGVKANFNSNSKPYDVTGALTVSGNRLYVGYKTGDAQLLKNSGEMPVAPFKTGGALDLMIGTNPASLLNRQTPVEGDLRLLVTLINGKPIALIYRAVVADAKQADKVPFSSPWRTITFDKVDDVSGQLEFAASNDGNYEISIPLSILNLTPKDGMSIKGDIGILRGDGTQTISRVYWNNKATAIVSDVPSEAELTPALWGTLNFKSVP